MLLPKKWNITGESVITQELLSNLKPSARPNGLAQHWAMGPTVPETFGEIMALIKIAFIFHDSSRAHCCFPVPKRARLEYSQT